MIHLDEPQYGLPPLRPYQLEAGSAIVDSIEHHKGLTFCVEIARQGGKNELSARLELILMAFYSNYPFNLIKCSPTFVPQSVVSMERLKDRMNDIGLSGYAFERGYIIRLVNTRTIFLSADEHANVVGHTAHLLLEVDEAQDVGKEKYTRDFRPMGSSTNVTNVLYGTPWDDSTLLEETKQSCLELERKDGLQRYFRFDWQEVVKHNPDYLAFVESERQRLGDNHPLFLTQYCLQPIGGGGKLLSTVQQVQLQGKHERCRYPQPGKIYIAGIDIAGEAGDAEKVRTVPERNGRDATVVTVGELDIRERSVLDRQPRIRIIEHFAWTGRKHTELFEQLVDILGAVWNCRRIVVDATGVGQPVASFLRQALGSRVVPFHFTSRSKSELGFNLLAAIDSGRLKMYRSDGSEESREFWTEMEKAKSLYRPDQTVNFFVDPSHGHDDFLMSLALLVEASEGYVPRTAKGRK